MTDRDFLITTAEGYFPKSGFVAIARSAVPSGAQESQEFRGGCPETAIAMLLGLG